MNNWIERFKNKNLTEEQQQKLDESKQINESLVRANKNFGLIDERILYNKDFLLEVQEKGYNPLDKEDVENYIQGLPAKNADRNIIMCGADKYKYLGQGEYEERDMEKFMKKNNIGVNPKKNSDVFLNDYNATDRKVLLEKTNEVDFDLSDVDLSGLEPQYDRTRTEDETQKNLAKYFGSDDIKLNTNPVEGNQIVAKNSYAEKTLELIKELKALGFNNEEIKKELQLRHK